MKSQTHYQVKTQTAGQVENKNQQYLPHKWRGNTLVPVIIALAISAIATVAFLNQGANLAADNKIVIAQNEIVAIHGEYTLVAFRKGATSVASTDLPFIYDTTNGRFRSNIFGKAYAYTQATAATGSGASAVAGAAATVTYGTDNNTTCTELATIVNRLSGLSAACAAGATTMTITLS